MNRRCLELSGADRALTVAGLGALAGMMIAPQARAVTVQPGGGPGGTMLPDAPGSYSVVFLDVDGVTSNGWDLAFNGTFRQSARDRADRFAFAFYARNGVQVAMSTQIMYGGGGGRGPIGSVTFAAPLTDPTSVSGWGRGWESGTGVIFEQRFGIGWTNYWSYYAGSTAYLGFRIWDGGARDTSYGWLLFSVGSSGSSLSISSWSGAASGNSAQSGNGAHSGPSGTPEPAASGLALLALGAAGVLRRRRTGQAA